MRSRSGSRSAPTRGRVWTCGGYSSKLLTATTWDPAPTANSISVTAGMSEMMRAGCADAPAVGITRADGLAVGTKATKATRITKVIRGYGFSISSFVNLVIFVIFVNVVNVVVVSLLAIMNAPRLTFSSPGATGRTVRRSQP